MIRKSQPDLTTGEIGWQSAPTVAGDVVLVGIGVPRRLHARELSQQQGLGARL